MQMVCKQLRFSTEVDIALLREVVVRNPFSKKNGKGWQETVEALIEHKMLPTSATIQTLRERTTLLLKKFEQENRENEARSGIEEEVGEKENVCLEIIRLRDEAEAMAKIKPQASDKDIGLQIREQALAGMIVLDNVDKEEDIKSPLGSPVTRGKKRKGERDDLVSFLERREERRQEQKKEELEMRRMEFQAQQEREERDREERREQAERQRERERLDREERIKMMEMLMRFTSNQAQ